MDTVSVLVNKVDALQQTIQGKTEVVTLKFNVANMAEKVLREILQPPPPVKLTKKQRFEKDVEEKRTKFRMGVIKRSSKAKPFNIN